MSSATLRHPLVDQLLAEIENRNLSKREAAEQLGVSERTVIYWSSVQAPTPQPRHRRAIVAWLDGNEIVEDVPS